MSVSLPTSPDNTISLRVVQLLIDVIEQTGVPRATILSALGEAAVALKDADARISSREVEHICEVALDITGDNKALGLLWARGLTERTFAPVSQLVGFAGSLRKSLELLSEYERLFCDQSIYQLSEHGELATLRLFVDWEFSSPRVSRLATEMAVAGFLVVIRLFDPQVALARVCFDYPAPAQHEAYTRGFGDGVQFDQDFVGLVFARSLLDIPSPHSDDDIQAAMQGVAERRLLRTAKNAPFAVRVRELLRERTSDRLNMSDVARALGLSVRSLRRQLGEEGISFRSLEHAALASQAGHLLRDKQLSIQETAYAMGFSDAATFHRALKQWTGMTPSEIRSKAQSRGSASSAKT